MIVIGETITENKQINYTEVSVNYGNQVGDDLLTEYDLNETLNTTIWKVQGGIFRQAEMTTFTGCLLLVDTTGKIMAQAVYFYN